MKLLNYTLILLFTFGMLSCSSSGGGSDKIAPVINFTNLSSSEGAYTPVTDDRFEIVITLTDDEELKSISFDGVTGGAVKHASEFLITLQAALDAQASDQLGVESKTIKVQLEDLGYVEPSKYIIPCNVTDASGNIATKKAYLEIK